MEHHDGKDGLAASTQIVDDGFAGNQTLSPEKAGTMYDRKDMERVGKRQELRVRRFLLQAKVRERMSLITNSETFASSRFLDLLRY
jgi:hypothetical protein